MVRLRYLLDTNMWIYALKGQPPIRLKTLQGLFSHHQSFAFDDAAAEIYGRIRYHLEASGTPIGPMDMLIAAIALTNDLILVTHNSSEFGRIAELKLEDWSLESQ